MWDHGTGGEGAGRRRWGVRVVRGGRERGAGSVGGRGRDGMLRCRKEAGGGALSVVETATPSAAA